MKQGLSNNSKSSPLIYIYIYFYGSQVWFKDCWDLVLLMRECVYIQESTYCHIWNFMNVCSV